MWEKASLFGGKMVRIMPVDRLTKNLKGRTGE